MKSTELKKLIKGAVKEAIQEEIKDILLEAVRSPKTPSVAVVQESVKPESPTTGVPTQPSMTAAQKKSLYEQALNDTTMNFNSSNVQSFQPQPGYDAANGTLPSGEVNMSMIAGLMNKK